VWLQNKNVIIQRHWVICLPATSYLVSDRTLDHLTRSRRKFGPPFQQYQLISTGASGNHFGPKAGPRILGHPTNILATPLASPKFVGCPLVVVSQYTQTNPCCLPLIERDILAQHRQTSRPLAADLTPTRDTDKRNSNRYTKIISASLWTAALNSSDY